ncbi:hypothetical protein V6N13_052662 [Hibiscus sabdariffa]
MVPAAPDYDQETITDEERVMFRRVGLRMKPNKQKTLAFVEDTARVLLNMLRTITINNRDSGKPGQFDPVSELSQSEDEASDIASEDDDEYKNEIDESLETNFKKSDSHRHRADSFFFLFPRVHQLVFRFSDYVGLE